MANQHVTRVEALAAVYQLSDALQVLIQTPHIREFLRQHDPKALAQAESAAKVVAEIKALLA